jgi:hypothetical protein
MIFITLVGMGCSCSSSFSPCDRLNEGMANRALARSTHRQMKKRDKAWRKQNDINYYEKPAGHKYPCPTKDCKYKGTTRAAKFCPKCGAKDPFISTK